MSHPADDRRSHDGPNEGTPKARSRAKILIPLGILLVIIAIFVYILVVAQTGADDESDVYENVGSAAVVEVSSPTTA
ncbi:hypothetical protein [Blastococcus montanus]|uniref:hypothetical protein n=1 Tax=Blastococcus montanus TaxID=3144973 RepID=UPI003207FBB0